MWSRLKSENAGGQKPLIFSGFRHGLNTSTPASQIASSECSELINYGIHPNGTLETRRPITKYIETQITGSPTFFEEIPIGGTNYELTVGSDYKLYYNNEGTQTLIGTLEGDARLIAYNGVCMVLDGSYIKYLDGISDINIAYDDGTGSSGYQFTNTSGGDDTGLAVGNGTNTRIAYAFTSQSWDSGYTIPPTTFSAVLQREGNGFTGTDNVDINVVIRKVSDGSSIASKAIISAPIATNLSDTATTYSVTFASTDITTEMSPGVEYYASVEYNNGDATHYCSVRCESVAGNAYVYAGSWAADATKDPLMSLRPGMPPKASFGAVAKNRVFLAGDPDNPGYVWFTNLTHLDYSTSDGGGYVGAVDGNKNNYEVGGIASLYGDVYVFGTSEQPYLCKLGGTSPSAYSLPALFQKIWTLPDTVQLIGNDIMFVSQNGVKTLSGVQEYGDLRTFSVSKQIKDRFDDYWSADSVTSFFPEKGQFWLSMPDFHRTIVFNNDAISQSPDGNGSRYPVSEYEICHKVLTTDYTWVSRGNDIYYLQSSDGGDPEFDCVPDALTLDGKRITKSATIGAIQDHEWWYGDANGLTYDTVYFKDNTGNPDSSGVVIRSVMIPTCLSSFGGGMYIGCSDGYIYHVDSSEYRDMESHQILPSIGTNIVQFPFGEAEINELQVIVSAKGGCRFSSYFYLNGSRKSAHTSSQQIVQCYDDLTVGEATMAVEDALFLVDPTTDMLSNHVNMDCFSVQIFIENMTIAGYPVFINGLMLKYRMLP